MKYPLLISALLTSTALAETWTVDDDGKADFDNIQAAVDAASDGDEIIVAPGTYTSTADEVVDMLGKEIWLHSSGGAEVTIIDGEETRRGILCDNSETPNTIIEGFTITNGYSGSGVDYYHGGGMYNVNSSPTLTDCIFTNNIATNWGGAMCNYGSSPTLTTCTFTDNTADNGGGIQNASFSNPTLTDCIFTNNIAANRGGGMRNDYDSNPTLTTCTFTGNSATIRGGGMENSGGSTTLTTCTFTSNSADSGGGMYNTSGNNSTLTDCIFTNNTAISNGGGMLNVGSNPTLSYCTFTDNTADYGGGMYNGSNSSPTLTNCTLCSNTPNQISGTWTDEGGNILAAICPIPGACCTNDGCVISEQEDCITFLGQWQGEGTTCENNPCPTSCLGDVTGDGQVNVSDLLAIIAVWGACP